MTYKLRWAIWAGHPLSKTSKLGPELATPTKGGHLGIGWLNISRFCQPKARKRLIWKAFTPHKSLNSVMTCDAFQNLVETLRIVHKSRLPCAVRQGHTNNTQIRSSADPKQVRYMYVAPKQVLYTAFKPQIERVCGLQARLKWLKRPFYFPASQPETVNLNTLRTIDQKSCQSLSHSPVNAQQPHGSQSAKLSNMPRPRSMTSLNLPWFKGFKAEQPSLCFYAF